MVWKYYPDKQPTEQIMNTDHEGNWWTDTVTGIEVQLTAETVAQLHPTFLDAFMEKKPYKVLFGAGKRAKWRKIAVKHREEELYISEYCDRVVPNFYKHCKIKSLKTNSISSYYRWSDLPPVLKRFIEDGR